MTLKQFFLLETYIVAIKKQDVRAADRVLSIASREVPAQDRRRAMALHSALRRAHPEVYAEAEFLSRPENSMTF